MVNLTDTVVLDLDTTFDLRETIAPVWWGRGRWPNHDLIDGHLWTVAEDDTGIIVRQIVQSGRQLQIATNRPEVHHLAWASRVLGIRHQMPAFSDPVVAAIAARHPGMRPWCNAGLFESIITAIVGQAVSVQAAAIFEQRLCAMTTQRVPIGDRLYHPFPTAAHILQCSPEQIQTCGVTGNRARAIHQIAILSESDALPSEYDLATDADNGIRRLMSLPMIGRWTAESVLLWGLGAANAHPSGDVALLRAARLAYARPELTLKDLDHLSEQWQPSRSWAARLLWLNLLGPAPASDL
ncbi:MAG TPA: hypothetical protein PK691_00215 [Thermomicrobiales bacterium]|nr:hypothetical protein [Thermomicrobiales bacterium]HRA46594.1 hypothetical protein [Thermomicrobiales bacterium]